MSTLFITPKELKIRAEKIWRRGELHKAWLLDEPLFPVAIGLPAIPAKALLNQFSEVQEAVSVLRQDSRKQGYQLNDKTVSHRQLGEQKIPAEQVFATAADFLRYLGKIQAFAQFQSLAQQTLSCYPQLKPWLLRYPFKLMTHAAVWPQVLAVCQYLEQHPRPDCYIRQLDIAGVDTKFIETHKGLLSELLERILPETARDSTITGQSNHGFERRYGLRYDQPSVRLRILDKNLAVHGLTDLTLTWDEFKQWQLPVPVKTIFVVENKINGLAFPYFPASIVIFGLGYAVDLLVDACCMQAERIFYWGDLDTHGFAMLSRLRKFFPQVASLLMDEQTLDAFESLWVSEPLTSSRQGAPAYLTGQEQALFERLKNTLIRLEQERIAFSYLTNRLNALLSCEG